MRCRGGFYFGYRAVIGPVVIAVSEPEHVIAIDFETYYDADYSLTNMPTAQYIFDPRFEVIGCAYRLDDEPAIWCPGWLRSAEIQTLPWDNAVAVAHNAMFDGLILEHCYGIKPARYFCTSMGARPVMATVKGDTKLATVAEFFGIGAKGTEVLGAKGLRIGDFSPEQLDRYGEYCKNDVNLTYMLYYLLLAWYEKNNKNVA